MIPVRTDNKTASRASVLSAGPRSKNEGALMREGQIGTLENVLVRKVWPDEAGDFTPWLADHVELLSEALGMELELEGREVTVGEFSADLVLRDLSSDGLVVLENMYGSTNHDHLGKLITYAAGLRASYAVLLAEKFRPDHHSALNWLNSVSSEDCGFFGLALEIWRIGDSIPAPRLQVVVRPDDWSRSVRATKERQDSERNAMYRSFWAAAQTDFRKDSSDWAGRGKPSKHSWMSFKRRQGVAFNVAFCKPDGVPRLRVEAYVDTGDQEDTAELYRELEERRPAIEMAFGEELEWSALQDKRASRISSYFSREITVDDEEQWTEAYAWMVPTLRRLRAAVEPILDEL